MAKAMISPGFRGPFLLFEDVPWPPLGRAHASNHDTRTPLLDAPLLDAPEVEERVDPLGRYSVALPRDSATALGRAGARGEGYVLRAPVSVL